MNKKFQKRQRYLNLVAKDGQLKIETRRSRQKTQSVHQSHSSFIYAGKSIDELLARIDKPAEVQSISLVDKKRHASYPADVRNSKFELFADAFYRARTNNDEETIQALIEELKKAHSSNERQSYEMWNQAHNVDTVEISQNLRQDSANGANEKSRSWFGRTLGRLNPQHQFSMALLLIGGSVVSLVGPASLFQFLMENSDVYAMQPWLATPLAVIPAAAGIGIELHLQKIEPSSARNRAEGTVFKFGVAAFALWLVGLMDMANVDTGAIGTSGFNLPDGLRVIAQILLEVPIIAMITGRILEILRWYWRDELSPSDESKLRVEAAKAFDADIHNTTRDELARLLPRAGVMEAARRAYVLSECAHFAEICADHDRWAQE